MVGKIFSAVTPFYDSINRKKSFKARPVLVISGPRNNDYTVLPVSRVTNKDNLDMEYDIKIDPAAYPLLHLKCVSYVRAHKQTTIHKSAIAKQIGDIKGEYEDLYLGILEKLEQYHKNVIDDALAAE